MKKATFEKITSIQMDPLYKREENNRKTVHRDKKYRYILHIAWKRTNQDKKFLVFRFRSL